MTSSSAPGSSAQCVFTFRSPHLKCRQHHLLQQQQQHERNTCRMYSVHTHNMYPLPAHPYPPDDQSQAKKKWDTNNTLHVPHKSPWTSDFTYLDGSKPVPRELPRMRLIYQIYKCTEIPCNLCVKHPSIHPSISVHPACDDDERANHSTTCVRNVGIGREWMNE
jgi:hypothetical protein